MDGLDEATLPAHQLLDAAAVGVVEVLRVDRGLGARRLGRERAHPVRVVPREVSRGRLGCHVAVRVERVVDGGGADLHALHPVAARLKGNSRVKPSEPLRRENRRMPPHGSYS